jgi:hypothetical protein
VVDFFGEFDIFAIELFETFVQTGIAELSGGNDGCLFDFDLDDVLADFIGAGLVVALIGDIRKFVDGEYMDECASNSTQRLSTYYQCVDSLCLVVNFLP